VSELKRGSGGDAVSRDPSTTSVPGVLKNTIGWVASFSDSAWAAAAAVMGASVGSRHRHAQYHLHRILVLDMPTLNQPEVMIGTAHKRFDESGALTDETSRKLVSQLLAALVGWTRRLRGEA
jgi:chromate reductase